MSMRPGDWMCASCNNHNFASRSSCFKCGEPKTSDAEEVTEESYGGGRGGRGGYGSSRPGDWNCAECGTHNFASRDKCFGCSANRAGSEASEGGSYGGGRGGGRSNYYGGDQRPGDWLCEQCGSNNFARRDSCFRCHEPKSGERGGGYGGGNRGGGRAMEKRPGDWDCPQCDAVNFASREQCFGCGESAPK